MKLPGINCKQVMGTPATKLDIRHGKLDPGKIMLMATWEPGSSNAKGFVRYGIPTATFWRAWKIRRKSIFAAGIRPIRIDGAFRLEWRSKEPLPALEVQSPTPAVKRAGKAVSASRKAMPLRFRTGLLKHQLPAVQRHLLALERHGGSLEASTTGVGKTFIALAVARELGLRPAIVCPKNIISGWQGAAEQLDVEPLFVNNYEQLKAGNQWGVDPLDRCGVAWALPKKVMTIFDEAHRLKNQLSQNSALAIGCREAGIPTMQLSATIAQDPTEMFTTGLLLALHKGGTDFHRWAQEYGCAFDGMGLVWRGNDDDIQRLHLDLFPEHGSRIRGEDIASFPKSFVIPKSLDCENVEELQAIYEQMQEEMDRHAEKLEGDGLKLLNALCAMTRARQHAELLKVPMMVELILDLFEQGHSVPVFVNFSETLDAIAARLPAAIKFSVIRGGQTKNARNAERDLFQADKHRVILCQIRAGGESISLHDLHGRHPRASVISPGFSAREVIQACGRTPRAKGKSKCLQYIVFAHGTIEDAAFRRVVKKAGDIERLNDGDLAVGFLGRSKK